MQLQNGSSNSLLEQSEFSGISNHCPQNSKINPNQSAINMIVKHISQKNDSQRKISQSSSLFACSPMKKESYQNKQVQQNFEQMLMIQRNWRKQSQQKQSILLSSNKIEQKIKSQYKSQQKQRRIKYLEIQKTQSKNRYVLVKYQVRQRRQINDIKDLEQIQTEKYQDRSNYLIQDLKQSKVNFFCLQLQLQYQQFDNADDDEGIEYAKDVFKVKWELMYKQISAQIIEQYTSYGIRFNQKSYQLNHRNVKLDLERFTFLYLPMLQYLDISLTGIDDQKWKIFVEYCPLEVQNLKILIIKGNFITQVVKEQLQGFKNIKYIDFGQEEFQTNKLSSQSQQHLYQYINANKNITVKFRKSNLRKNLMQEENAEKQLCN